MISMSNNLRFCAGYVRPQDWWKDGGIRYEEDLKRTQSSEPIAEARSSVQSEFDERAARWERETAIHSAPGEALFHLDYIAIVTMGRENEGAVIPLILKRLQTAGADWFFVLQMITYANPAGNAETFEEAFNAWCEWAKRKGIIKDKHEVLGN